MALPRGNHDRHWLAAPLGPQVDLGAKAALATPQGFRLSVTARGPRRMLMGTNDSGIDLMDGPLQRASRIGLLLERVQDLLPDAGLPPAIEAAGHCLPGTIARRQPTPGGTGAEDPQDAVDNRPMVVRRATGLGFLGWEQGRQLLPLVVGQVSSIHVSGVRVCKLALAT